MILDLLRGFVHALVYMALTSIGLLWLAGPT